jgi:hypothetical protein
LQRLTLCTTALMENDHTRIKPVPMISGDGLT